MAVLFVDRFGAGQYDYTEEEVYKVHGVEVVRRRYVQEKLNEKDLEPEVLALEKRMKVIVPGMEEHLQREVLKESSLRTPAERAEDDPGLLEQWQTI
jgi:hypothetical protein